jgi:cytochrome P450
MSAIAPPPPFTTNPARRIWTDVRDQRRAARRAPLPPGPTSVSPLRDLRFMRDTPAVLLEAYEQYGPVFTMRLFHALGVWMIGPEAQHFILVSDADKFVWREGAYRELIPLLGDGLITTDDEYHDRSRRLMLPVFHTERLAAATRIMVEEADRGLDRLDLSEPVEVYGTAREVAMRVAMRALFGLDPDAMHATDVAREFERGLSFYGEDLVLWLLRGPRTPFARLQSARKHLAEVVLAEIARRRRDGGHGEDILSLLMLAEDEDGWRFTDAQLLDHSLTLLFAGHDTTTTTTSFLLYELARSPLWLERVTGELDSELGGEPASEEQLFSGLPVLEQALDETLRLYPPVPAGLRRAVKDFELAGHRVPAGAMIQYSSWASHRLPDVFPEPLEFRPERMEREAKAKLPKGAYVPFGGGKRICIGKRFGYLEAKVIASRVLQRYTPTYEADTRPTVKWSATLIPKGGLPMRFARRG